MTRGLIRKGRKNTYGEIEAGAPILLEMIGPVRQGLR